MARAWFSFFYNPPTGNWRQQLDHPLDISFFSTDITHSDTVSCRVVMHVKHVSLKWHLTLWFPTIQASLISDFFFFFASMSWAYSTARIVQESFKTIISMLKHFCTAESETQVLLFIEVWLDLFMKCEIIGIIRYENYVYWTDI